MAGIENLAGKEKGAKKRLNYLILLIFNMEAEVGIEPASTALQAAALLYNSIAYALCHSLCHAAKHKIPTLYLSNSLSTVAA
ncbi:MAG: hypothetical protein DIZ78_08175 [endosymbiont of Escarpia spicata]|uniref:Uncharacterized protein n=1 Tax=endosymbiont of Escarpia spicata TaxID=2200908 RepID=A0A370DPZ6_9GAMM|nr:MAG: hypothetical protein DIZ78_08175 [endosymbiont of Escarpia spicata]